jgi:hypothetical protein
MNVVRTTRTRANNTRLQAAVFLAAVATMLRGGAASAASAVVNFSREGFNLQVLATYGTVTALVMKAALRLFTSTKFPKNDKISTKVLTSIFTAVTAFCVISGAFTATLFNILGIYSKSALGMLNEVRLSNLLDCDRIVCGILSPQSLQSNGGRGSDRKSYLDHFHSFDSFGRFPYQKKC